MQIGITNELRKFLGHKPYRPNSECDLFFCWDANRVKIDGRVMLVLCNAANRLCCIRAMRGTDWRNLGRVCEELIRKTLLWLGFSASAASAYLDLAGYAVFGRTHGRKSVGCMSRAIDDLYVCDCDHEHQFQGELTYFINDLIGHCATRTEYGTPLEWMEEDLRAHGIDPFGDNEPDDALAMLRSYFPIADGQVDEEKPKPKTEDTPRCSVCGAEPRVWVGSVPYCLSCHNKMAESELGISHATRDDVVFVAFDQGGRAVQFAVERMVLPRLVSWTAREMVASDDPRLKDGYEGITVSLYTDMRADVEDMLGELSEKAQEVLSRPSVEREAYEPGFWLSNGVARGNGYEFANEQGWGSISSDEGGHYIVVDGQRYSGEEFLELLSCYEGFNLCWQVRDVGGPLY